MPNVEHVGISRRIDEPEERERLSGIVERIRPEGMGAIVRTAAEGKTELELKADMDKKLAALQDRLNAALPSLEMSKTLAEGNTTLEKEVARLKALTDSERQRNSNPRKLYPADPGLIGAFDASGRAHLGHALETVALHELERRGAEVGYVKTADGLEVGRRVTWLELFFDLVFVAAVAVSSSRLSTVRRASASRSSTDVWSCAFSIHRHRGLF